MTKPTQQQRREKKKQCKQTHNNSDNYELHVSEHDEYVSSNIKFVYPYEVICPKGQCTIIDGDISYYQDPTHLTLDGALKVVKEIRKQLEI